MAKFIEVEKDYFIRVDGVREINVYKREWGHKTLVVSANWGVITLHFNRDDSAITDTINRIMRAAT